MTTDRDPTGAGMDALGLGDDSAEDSIKKSGRIEPTGTKLGDYLGVPIPDNQAARVFYNPGFPSTPPAEITPGVPAVEKRDEKVNPTTGESDISNHARETLSQYTVDIAKKVNFNYPDPGSSGPSPGHQKGDVIPKVSDSTAFHPTNQSDSQGSGFDTESGGAAAGTRLGSFFGSTKLDNIINKPGNLPTPGGDIGPFSGNTLLKKGVQHSAEGDLEKTTLVENIESVLQEENRYSPESNFSETQTPYIANKNTPTETAAYSKGLYSIQTGTGIKGKYNKDAPWINVLGLRKLALELMVNASGHQGLVGNDVGMDGSIGAALSNMAALMPSITQIGAGKISVTLLRIKNVDGAMDQSFGVLNNPDTGPLEPDLMGNVNAKAGQAAQAMGLGEGETAALIAKLKSGEATLLFQSMGADDIILVQTAGSMFGLTAGGAVIKDLGTPMNMNSYGQMNSFLEPFDGPMPMGMMFITLYGLLGALVLGGIVEAAMSPTSKGAKNRKSGPPRSLGMGMYGGPDVSGDSTGEISALFMRLFGIHDCDASDYASAVTRGVMSFYGFPKFSFSGPFDVMEMLGTALNVALAPGYYATITKQVLRDIEQITAAGSGFQTGMPGLSAVTQVFKLVESLFSSTTFKFINTMAIIGDIQFKAKYDYGHVHGGPGTSVLYENEKSITGITPKIRQDSRSRFFIPNGTTGGGSWVQKLALWTFPSILYQNKINDDFLLTHMGTVGFDTDMAAGHEGDRNPDGTLKKTKFARPEKYKASWASKRLPKIRMEEGTVKAIEAVLDQEYIPFSIHDLRTNEVIGMPAFIGSISDSFSAEYNSTQGFGRTDPVHIYGGTKRSVDCTFTLAATSEADHKYMWYVINKMVAMCYPMRSKGRQRVFMDGDNQKQFIQPFSQVPTASPMVRLRLGDVIASNYSEKGLGRLFGMNRLDEFNTDVTKDEAQKMAEAELKAFKEWSEVQVRKQAIDTVKNGEFKGMLMIKKGAKLMLKDSKSSLLTVKADTMVEVIEDLGANTETKDDVYYKCKWTAKMGNNKTINSRHPFTATFKSGRSQTRARLRKEYGGGRGNASKQENAMELICFMKSGQTKQWSLVEMTPGDVDSKIAKEVEDKAKELGAKGEKKTAPADRHKFMLPGNNPIVRSFNSTKGRGLAGFITQMSLGYENATWEINRGSRAPQKVEIQISFSPIHDLPLGIDQFGNLIAPSHPVGMAHVDPWAQGYPGTPPEKALGDVENKQLESIMTGPMIDATALSEEDDPNEGTSGAKIPPSTPAPSLGGFDPMQLMSAVGGLGALKDLF